MYYHVIRQCSESFRAFEGCLDKAERYAKAKGLDADDFLTRRLAPDMQPFVYQVQSVSDYIKAAAAWLSGQTPPRYEDNEKTIDELRARIRKTVAYVDTIKEAQYVGAADRKVSVSWVPGKVIAGEDYLLQLTIPNTYFHLSMAYAILRHNGVDIGKMDFLDKLRFKPA